MYNTSGVQSYQNIGVESAVMNASPHQLIVMLFDGAHSALSERLFLDAGQLAEKGRALSKAINIIDNGLKAALNVEAGGELSINLASLYEYMVRRLLIANLHNDVEAIVEVENLLNNIADAWKQIGPNASSISG